MESTEHRPDNGVEILSEAMCWERLRRTSIGRLGVHHDNQPAIYPINYLVDGTSIVFRTRRDSKIAQAPHLERVAGTTDYLTPMDPTFDLLGEPPFSLEQGVARTVAWFRSPGRERVLAKA